MQPRSKHWNPLEYITTRRKHMSDMHDTRVMRGFGRSTDHLMIRSKLVFTLRKQFSKTGSASPAKINVEKVRNQKVMSILATEMDSALKEHNTN